MDDRKLKYEAPKGVMSEALLSDMRAVKTELMALLRPMVQAADFGPLPTSRTEDRSLLSYAQERLWFLAETSRDSAAYNVSGALSLKGELNIEVLKNSIDEIVRRHEILRANIVTLDGQPQQIVNEESNVALEVVDLRQAAATQRELEDRLRRSAHEPFQLDREPLLRVAIFRMDDANSVLLITVHHIIADLWSLEIFSQELSQLYSAFLRGEASPLPRLPIQYGDYAAWQRKQVDSPEIKRQLAYWLQVLRETPALLDLPTDFPRPRNQTFSGATASSRLSRTASEGVKQLARAEECTLFMAMLAAFQVLLYRYSGQSDLCIGTPIATRSQPATQALIGFFVNTLVLRGDLSRNCSFRELLQQARERCIDAFDNQDVPFELVVDAVRPAREGHHQPLFQVMLVVQNLPQASLEMPRLRLSSVEIKNQTAKFDLTLFIADDGECLQVKLEYNTSLFQVSTAHRLLESFGVLVDGILHNPGARVSDLPILSEEQKINVYHHSCGETQDAIPHECLHDAFAAQVRATPGAIAFQAPGHTLTYEQLNHRANQLAHYLIHLGVVPEMRVGICLRRPPDMIGAVLAVLKAGGAYVPLDPGHPPQRLRMLVENAGVAILLTHRAVPDGIDLTLTRIVPLEDIEEIVRGMPTEDPHGDVRAANLAYIIFTSGSTGRPKGVMVDHSQIVNSTAVRMAYYGEQPERFLLLSPFAFDSSLAGTFWTLNHGGTLCLPGEGVQRDPERVAEHIERWKITHTLLLPSVHRLLLEHFPRLSSLRCVIVAGEACPAALPQQHYQVLPQADLFNEYGPTEAAVWSTAYRFLRDEHRSSVPIGRAIPNSCAFVLDPAMNLVATGVKGQLYLGGMQVSRGYLDEAALTAERFVPDPYGTAGARLYRTGDLARYVEDTNLEFLGRADEQLKIRGYRIEPREIEAALLTHAHVRDVAVIMVDDGESKRLVGYVVPTAEGKQLSSDELRRHLKQRLPEYMIPPIFVLLANLPLNRNGKLDRGALPDATPVRNTASYEPPTNDVEKTLSDIWAGVLKIERVGVHDNFFELGGDSILSIQVVARANNRGLRLTPTQVFQQQTIAELALVAQQGQGVEVENEAATGEVPLSPIQRLFFESSPEEPHHFNQSVMLESESPIDKRRMEEALRVVITHHRSLALRFQPAGGGAWRQYYGSPSPAAERLVVEIDLSGIPELAEAAQRNAADQLQRSLNLQWGPLIRVGIFVFEHWSRVLVLAHHLVVDGVSWRILLEDLFAVYSALVEESPAPQLPSRTASFKRWAESLMKFAKSPELLDELGYWQQQSTNSTAEIPVDKAGGSNTVGDEHTVLCELQPEDTRRLLQDVPEAYGTHINDVLLAALAETIGEWTGARAVQVDLEGHGRESQYLQGTPDVSRTVGWFTTLFPIVLEMRREGEGVGEHLKRCKERNRKTPRNGLGFGVLRYLTDEATTAALRGLPSAKVCFNYLGQWDGVLQHTLGFRASTASHGGSRSPRLGRRYLLDLNAAVAEGRLVIALTYSHNHHHKETVNRLAVRYIEHLREIITHCTSAQTSGYTPSDFPLANLTDDLLNEVLQKVSKG